MYLTFSMTLGFRQTCANALDYNTYCLQYAHPTLASVVVATTMKPLLVHVSQLFVVLGLKLKDYSA